MKTKLLNIIVFSIFAFIFSSILTNSKIFAKTCTWNGSQSGEWSNQNNWEADCLGMMPQDGDDLVFPATATNYVMNDFILDLHINSMDFHNSSYIVAGNTFFVGNSITTNGFRPHIQPDFTLTSNTTIEGLIANSIDLNLHSLTLDTNGDIPEIGSTISGIGNIFITGGGTARLDGNNTFTGNVTIGGSSTLEFYHTNSFSNAAVSIGTGSTLYYRSPGSLTVLNNMFFSDDSTLKVEGDLNEFAGGITGFGFLKVDVPAETSFILSGTLSAVGLIKQGEGQLVLTGTTNNSMDGVVISNGDLLLDKTSATAIQGSISINGDTNTSSITNNNDDQITDSSDLVLSGSNASWNLNNFDETVDQLAITSSTVDVGSGNLTTGLIIMDGGLIDVGTGSLNLLVNTIALDYLSESQGVITGGILNFAQDVVISRLDPLNSGGADLLIESNIHSADDLTIQGVYVTLAGDNTNLTGQINVGGVDTPSLLVAAYSHPLGANSSNKTVVNANASLLIDPTYASVNEILELNGTGVGSMFGENFGALVFMGSATSYNVAQILNIDSNTVITLLGDNQVDFNGVSDTVGGHNVWFIGPVLPLLNLPQIHMNDLFAGANDAITLAHMDMYLDSVQTLPNTGTVTFDNNSQLHLGANHQLAGIYGDGFIFLGSNTLDLTIDGVTDEYGGQILGNGTLIKSGALGDGKLIITGNQQYFSGTLQITNGTVVVNGDLSIGMSTVVLDGGILAGSGNVGELIANEGEIAPGNSPGILYLNGNTVLNSNVSYITQVLGADAGTGYDKLVVYGNLDLNSAFLVLEMNLSYVPTIGQQFTIVEANALTGVFGNYGEGDLITMNLGSYSVIYKVHYTGTTVTLTVQGFGGTLANTGINVPSVAIIAAMTLSLIGICSINYKYKFNLLKK